MIAASSPSEKSLTFTVCFSFSTFAIACGSIAIGRRVSRNFPEASPIYQLLRENLELRDCPSFPILIVNHFCAELSYQLYFQIWRQGGPAGYGLRRQLIDRNQ